MLKPKSLIKLVTLFMFFDIMRHFCQSTFDMIKINISRYRLIDLLHPLIMLIRIKLTFCWQLQQTTILMCNNFITMLWIDRK